MAFFVLTIILSHAACASELQPESMVEVYGNHHVEKSLQRCVIDTLTMLPIPVCEIIISYMKKWDSTVINNNNFFNLFYDITYDSIAFMEKQFVVGTSTGKLQIYDSKSCKLAQKISAHAVVDAVLYDRAADVIISGGQPRWFEDSTSKIKIWKRSNYENPIALHQYYGPTALCLFSSSILNFG